MADSHDIGLIAHLMRRAGFGASREELEMRAAKGYNATVEELLTPTEDKAADQNLLMRYQPASLLPGGQPPMGNINWMFHLVNTKNPLQEKMALFWHHVFATGNSKVDNYDQLLEQIDLFRQHGMGNYRDLLVELAKNPAMIYWLDNQENHKNAVNENWGRELLELFSMGQGNYTEKDVREASRAFTGWGIAAKIPRLPYGRFPWEFEYIAEDHDETDKEFLGHKGNFNGEDIIDIVVQQPACATFICRHLYNFFVADEPQVPSWKIEAPQDPEAMAIMMKAFRESSFNITAVLRAMFHADFFKRARFNKIKSPAEMVVSTLRLVGGEEVPRPQYGTEIAMQPTYMGQDLLNPPSVEGWHTGKEWINSGSLMSRINFAAEMVGNTQRPGVQFIVNRIKARGVLAPEQFVDTALDLMGPLEIGAQTRKELVDYANEGGELNWSKPDSEERVAQMLQLIVATREYQFN
ncbi:MAG: DUF1800 domain-containing protein [Candidatus Tectimicrobiota bacterium]